MAKENISQEFRPKNIDEVFIEEINENNLMIKKHRKPCMSLNYIEHLLILASVVTGCVSISAFASLNGIPIGIASCAVGKKKKKVIWYD